MAKDNCASDLSIAIAEIRKTGLDAIKEAMDKATEKRIIKGRPTDKQLWDAGFQASMTERFQVDFERILQDYRSLLENPDFPMNEMYIKQYQTMAERAIYDLIGRVRAVDQNMSMMESMLKGSDDVGAMDGIVGRMFNFFDVSARREEDLFNAREVDLWKTVEKGGTKKNPDAIARAKEFIRDSQAGGVMLFNHIKEKGYADPHRKMYDDLKEGSSDIEELNIIINVLKQLKEYKVMKLKTDYPGYVQPLSDFSYRLDLSKVFEEAPFVDFMKVGIHPHSFLRISKAEYESMGTRGEELFDKKLREQHKELIQPKIDAYNFGGSSRPRNPFLNNYWDFKDNSFEYEFMKRFADLRGGILGSYRNFLKNQLANAGREAVLSKSPQDVFVAIRNILYAKYKPQLKRGIEDVDQKIEPHAEEFRDRYEPKNVVNEDLANFRTGVMQTVSASLLGKSAIRNQAHDNTVHAGMVWHAYNDSGGITTYLQRAVALTRDVAVGAVAGTAKVAKAWATGKSIEPAKLSPAQEELKKIFEDLGLVIDVQMNSALAGVRKSKYDIDPLPGKKEGAVSNYLSWYARTAERFARTVSVMSGADAVNQSARIDAAIRAGGITERFFERATWDKLDQRDRVLLGNHGITEDLFNLLKKLKRNKQGIVSQKAFKEVDLKGMTSILETEQQVRKRLEFTYYNLINTIMDEISPLPSLQSEVSWVRGIKKNTPYGTLLSLMFKFSNISKATYMGLHRSMRRQVGLDPNHVNSDPLTTLPMYVELAKGNPMYLGKVLMGGAMGGAMINWTSELANGEPLSAITPEFIAKSLLRTSTIGYMGEVINNIYWGGSLIGDTSESIFKSGGRLVGVVEAATEAEKDKAAQRFMSARRSLPVTNVWWTGLMLDKAIRAGLDVPYSGYQKQKFDERGRLTEETFQKWDDPAAYIPGGD